MEFENLLKLIQAVSDSELTGLKYEEKGVKLHLTKEKETIVTAVQTADSPAAFAAGAVAAPAVQAAAPAAASAAAPGSAPAQAVSEETATEPSGKIVKSPLVGTFYAAPAEDADPYVSVGDTVKKGQVMAIVEAMKLMNEIESDFDGTVEEIYVENGQAVEYGQPLFRLS
ncbi:acetyl-CoA carboxylase biotin carboxyl carrier protein [Faecalicatena contorta]|uniref:acetyl-CoA carboxylase biotin carboxyl carrier protein n=1 Tax=Faecalicatena contorta TaxID=39482 RepID=UPI00174D0CD4|nr:acetyl-CoA carboxylase biotin carboxyl carrier protein [Faecalicatena contorta]MBM6686481.1 acetyl-CoA carboxylase biotin carboxyl carrier protein [Faecalicatena contorta]MBM6710729.1 acetyl-CoA carboxylase biotin carboxyl carrier protein [Faecalicatena contorta]HIX98926.1 acetyl-CoA carboxylase biotin carboxyl carrier protein [Candidatus Dorea intestinigallinarum]